MFEILESVVDDFQDVDRLLVEGELAALDRKTGNQADHFVGGLRECRQSIGNELGVVSLDVWHFQVSCSGESQDFLDREQ